MSFRTSRAQKDKGVQNSLFQMCVDEISISLVLICIFSFKISSLQLNFKGRSQTLCSDPFVHSPFCKQNSAREFNSKVSENITVKFIAPS